MVESSCQLDALQEKLKDIRPGDTVVLEDGTSVDQSITIDIDGESDRPIRIRAMNPGKVVLTGQSTVCVTGKHLSLEGLRFERCTLEDSCMVLDGARDCRVVDCRFVHSGGKRAAISIQGTAARNTIERCEFAHLEQRSIQVIIRGEEAPVDNRIVFQRARERGTHWFSVWTVELVGDDARRPQLTKPRRAASTAASAREEMSSLR